MIRQDNDMTPELFNFHQVISELQADEENMLDIHKHTIEQMFLMSQKADQLLHTAEEVTYDQEGKINCRIGRLYFINF